jgi:phosphoserine/homoserine phosphotransferase
MISGIKLCIENHKKLTLKYMNKLNFNTIAIGDSLNDIGMLKEAKAGIFFKSTASITDKYRSFYRCDDYKTLENKIDIIFERNF